MPDQSGGKGALSEPIVTISNHGSIAQLELPDGFVATNLSQQNRQNNYLEFKVPGGTSRICYEESREPLMDEDILEMEKLFEEKLPSSKTFRRLNLYGEDESAPDDSAIYGALCQCFVFGGCLVRDGACIDMDESSWELRTLGSERTVMIGRLKFFSSTGKQSKREAILIMANPPGPGGCGYVWLEGTSQELTRFESQFLKAIEIGKFQSLTT